MFVLLVVVITIFLIGLVPVTYYVNLYVEGKGKLKICLKVSVMGLTFVRENLSIPNFTGRKTPNEELLNLIYFFKAIRIKRISCYIKYGFNDPFVTGITAGLMWNVVVFAFGILSLFFNIDSSDLCVDLRPDFSGYKPLELHFESIMSMRIGHIITAGLSPWRSRFKQKIRGSERTWKDILLKT